MIEVVTDADVCAAIDARVEQIADELRRKHRETLGELNYVPDLDAIREQYLADLYG